MAAPAEVTPSPAQGLRTWAELAAIIGGPVTWAELGPLVGLVAQLIEVDDLHRDRMNAISGRLDQLAADLAQLGTDATIDRGKVGELAGELQTHARVLAVYRRDRAAGDFDMYHRGGI